MTDTATKPEGYVSERWGGPFPTNVQLDRLVNPEESGEIRAGSRAGSQQLRRQRWERLSEIFVEIRDMTKEHSEGLMAEMGYVTGSAGADMDHRIGFVVVVEVRNTKSPILSAVTDRTRNEELRLLDIVPVSDLDTRFSAMGYLLSLPPMNGDSV